MKRFTTESTENSEENTEKKKRETDTYTVRRRDSVLAGLSR